MAVNEDLYSWLLKTQGMPAAEWYRSNPTKPHTSNPHVPPGAAKWFPQASTGGSDKTYASVSPDIVEESITDNSPSSYLQALYQLPEDEYETFRANLGKNIRRFESEDQLKQLYPGATYSQHQVPKYDDILITDYGMGFKDIGSGAHYLFSKYLKDAQGQALRDDYTNRLYPAYQNMAPDGEVDIAIRLANLDAEAKANKQAQYDLARKYNQLYSGKTVEGWDENAFYAKNISLPTRQNLAALVQQSEQGIDSSKQFLDDYVAKGREEAAPKYGPRGEDLGAVASILPPAMTQGDLYRAIQERGGSSPGTKEYGELRDLQKEWIQRQQKMKGAEAPQENQPVDVRVARAAAQSDEQKERLTQQSEFDMAKEKQLASARAADAYRRSAADEDPFRAAARVG